MAAKLLGFNTPGLGVPAGSVPSGAMNSLVSAGNTINSALSGVVGAIPQIPQYFFTVPFPNNQTVLYRLRIYDNPASPKGANIAGPFFDEFIFPLTPSNVTKQSINLTSYYDV